MKRLNNLTLIFTMLALGLWSCNNEENLLNDDASSEATVVSEEQFDADFDDALDIAFSTMDAQLNTTGGRVATDERTKCAEVTKSNDTIVVNFGEGCESPAGRLREGKLIIKFSGKYFEPGAVITLSFDNFYLNGKKLEGTRTVTNLSASTDEYPKHNINLENGKITWPDGTTMTRETDRTRIWKRAANPINDIIEIFGSASGINKKGISYSATVAESTPVILKRSCIASQVFVPVQGIKIISRSERASVAIDYGDGTCDTKVVITVGERSKEIDLKDIK